MLNPTRLLLLLCMSAVGHAATPAGPPIVDALDFTKYPQLQAHLAQQRQPAEDGYWGFVVDLNADAVKDFLVLEPVQTCGNGGCGGVILDGRDFREVGSAAMDFEVMPQRINGWHLLEVVARSGARTAYPCMAYIGRAYQVISWDRCDAHAHLRNPEQMRAMGDWN